MTKPTHPFAGRHPMTTTTRALLDATKGHPRRLKRVLSELQDLWDHSAIDVGIGDMLNRLEYGTPLPRSTAPAMWRPGD